MEPVILARGLRKTFGRTAALDGLDLTVSAGTVHGFLGPNGAGKSTTIRVLLGLIRASGGEVQLFGKDPWRDAVELHRKVAYVPGDVTLWPNLTGGEAINLLMNLRGDSVTTHARRDELIEAFALDPTKKGRSYSKGNRQKVALVAALASDADLFILDEPTSGLDPLMEDTFQTELKKLRDAGKTVLLSSHILSEVEKACSHVSIVRAGRVVESGSLAELRHLRRSNVTAVLTAEPVDTSTWPGAHDVRIDGRTVQLSVEPRHLGDVMTRLGAYGLETMECHPPSLEELFLDRYRDGRS